MVFIVLIVSFLVRVLLVDFRVVSMCFINVGKYGKMFLFVKKVNKNYFIFYLYFILVYWKIFMIYCVYLYIRFIIFKNLNLYIFDEYVYLYLGFYRMFLEYNNFL